MKTNTWLFSSILLSIVIMCCLPYSSYGKKLYDDRIYEPIVLRGAILAPFYGVPIDEIYLYAYNEATQSWRMMPYQIDEMVYAEDPFKPGVESAWQEFYFLPANSILDSLDELVFLVPDMGDEAPENSWISDPEARTHIRLEITASDPFDSQNRAYAYAYQSSTITEDVPTPYDFQFNPQHHIAETKFYSVRMSQETGLIEDIAIKAPLGSGVDIFDTQKLRFIGMFDFGIFNIPIGKSGNPAANERDNLYVYNYLEYTEKPVVRLIRQVRQTIRFGTFTIDATAFYVRTKFYPYSGMLSGGANIDPERLKEEFHTNEDIYVSMDLLRQSWDFNQAASGMTFYSKYNDGIVIDGAPDVIDKQLDAPIKEWMLTTGDQGSLFSFIQFDDTSWNNIGLYYYDNHQGGQDDGTVIEGGDTGDSVSYGDQGIILRNLEQNSVSLELGFIAYFLPSNLNQADGEQLALMVKNPVQLSSTEESFSIDVRSSENPDAPEIRELFQNYPNPFNQATTISFGIKTEERIKIIIHDIQGRIVKTVADQRFDKGLHHVRWDGTNSFNQDVAAGVYLCVIRSDDFSDFKKLILLR